MVIKTALLKKLFREGADPSQILVRFELRHALRDCETILDIGCGPASPLQQLEFDRLVGLEGYRPAYETAVRNKTHHELVCENLSELDRLFAPKQFDACVALDVIEHLPKEVGLKLMASMERIAAKKVVFFTPKGFLPQHHLENNDLQEHLSGWEPEEMQGHGYRVTGLLGPKCLRGEFHSLKYWPKIFWGLVSLLGQCLVTRWLAKHAAAILCVKDLRFSSR